MQAQGIQTYLKGTEVQVAVGPLVSTAGGWMCKNGSAAVPSSFNEDSLGQLKIEVGSCFRGLIRDMRSMALQTTPFVSGQLKQSRHLPIMLFLP